MTTNFPVYENVEYSSARTQISEYGYISFKPWGNPWSPSSSGLRRLWDTYDSYGSTTGAIYIPAQCDNDSAEYKAAYEYHKSINDNKFYVSGY